jgi:hypothetical protein
LLVFSIICWSFIFLLIFATINSDSAWATVAVTGILVIITAYYAITTESLLRVNSDYAFTTEKMLKVNRETLELLTRELELHTLERRSAKVEEIIKIILVPLDQKIKFLKQMILEKRNVILNNVENNRIQTFTLTMDIRFPTASDYVKFQFESIKIDENYDDPCFRKNIGKIIDYIKEFDKYEQEYVNFINTEAIPIFRDEVIPYLIKNPTRLSQLNCHTLFSLLSKGKIDPIDIYPQKADQNFVSEHSPLIDDLYESNEGVKTFFERKERYDKKLFETLELLENEINNLLSSWMNIYHIPLTPT